MTSASTTLSSGGATDQACEHRAEVAVIGAGLIGLWNAMQYAKRGLSVIVIDELTERQKASFKVGESLLVYSNAFLRAVGDLDKPLSASRPKGGFWMAYGMEGRTHFDNDVSEWGFQSRLPERWIAAIRDQRFARTMFGDVQICRPEIEEELRANVAQHKGIAVLDHGLVRTVTLGADDADHRMHWISRDGRDRGTVQARWIVDCSGRARLLAKMFGHDHQPPRRFRNSAVWAQFSRCTDDLFDDRWKFAFPDGEVIRRDDDTVHLWGDGYWIWLIKLSGERISVGVSFDRDRSWANRNMRDIFWDILRRYPVLDFLDEANVLELRAYRDAQHYTDTFVSPRRYALSGDAGSIVDAYYSQGISLSLATSWHCANLVTDDVRHGVLDTDYLARINRCALADWRILASMIRGKYGPALADSRFFTLDHLLDYMVFGAALLGRYRISRWLAETGGVTAREKPEHQKLRRALRRRLFLSQSLPWNRLPPELVAGAIERWHDVLESNACWRLEHGVRLPATKTGLRAHAALPGVWRLPRIARRERADLTLGAIKEPAFMRLKGTEKRPLALAGSGPMLLIFNTSVLLFDVTDTTARKVVHHYRERYGRRGPR